MEVMIAIPSVGKQTANTLLAFMPELGMLTRKTSPQPRRPHPRDSGKTNGYRRTVGGRAQVRRALSMAAMTATNHHPSLRAVYKWLVKNGKKPLVALTAVMRKLITIINAKLRDHAMAQTW
jgi:transposase